MKKIFTLLLALMMVLSLAGCGDKDDPKPSGSGGSGASQNDDKGGKDKDSISFKDASADNWNTVIKNNVGMSFELPDGWTVDKVEAGKTNIKIYFVTDYGKTENDDLCKAFSETIFEQIKTVATGGVHDFNDPEMKSIDFSAIADRSKVDLEAPYPGGTIVAFYHWFQEEFELFIMTK